MRTSWTRPYERILKTEHQNREFSSGVQDGDYCKAWNGLCPRYPDQRTHDYNEGFKTATGFSPADWDWQ